jgi:predicted GIY-YIG superfamily endonuclease
MPWVYILRSSDNTLYVGYSNDVPSRVHVHRQGLGANYTSLRLPVDLVYTEECASTDAAVRRERQLKRWSAQKKAALIRGDLQAVRKLAKRRRP